MTHHLVETYRVFPTGSERGLLGIALGHFSIEVRRHYETRTPTDRFTVAHHDALLDRQGCWRSHRDLTDDTSAFLFAEAEALARAETAADMVTVQGRTYAEWRAHFDPAPDGSVPAQATSQAVKESADQAARRGADTPAPHTCRT